MLDNILDTWNTTVNKAKTPAHVEITFLFFPLIINYFLMENI